MSTTAVFESLKNMGFMPAPSSVAMELIGLCRDNFSSPNDIAAVAETDPALSAKLLDYSNLAAGSTSQKTTSIQHATARLSKKTVANLTLGFSLLLQNKSGTCKKFDYHSFWAHALVKAIAARSLCRLSEEIDPDEMFICGLLSRIGTLAFVSQFQEDYPLLLSAPFTQESLLQKEEEQFGINHKELSGRLLLSWGLPEYLFLETVAIKDNISDIPQDDSLPLIFQILSLADTVAEICMFEIPLGDKISIAEQKAHILGIDEEEFSNLFDTIVEIWQNLGTAFEVNIPDCPFFSQIKEIDQTQQLEPIKETPIRVLAVDDDPMTLLTLEHMLKNSGKEVYTAENGKSALALALEKRPDMVITDWKMPNGNGIDLLKKLRGNNSTKHIYIIMLTGRESEDKLVEALDTGADEFVLKPFTPRVLEARINSGERIIRFQKTASRDREVIQQYAARLAAANRKLQAMAMTDALTGLPNRRSAMERLKKTVAEAQRYQESIACIMIDIDHFKRVNDTHGHDIGDQVLIKIAAVFKETVRSYDSVCRLGGEEFLVICGRSSLHESQQLAERLRLAVEKMRIEVDSSTIKTTISLGVAAWSSDMDGGEEMIRIADNALYQAKKTGRNKVMVN